MNWKDIAPIVARSAPLLGTLLGGPAGAAAGALVSAALGVGADPGAVEQALAVSPDAAVKLAQIEATRSTELEALVVSAEANRLAADTAALQAVNATMQAEGRSEHWPQWGWRPFIGFVFGVMVLGCYFVLPLAKVPVPPVPESVWLMFGAVLGVASWFRGKEKISAAS